MSDQSLYFIAVVPESPVLEEVMAFKNTVAQQFSSKGALRSPPHITLHMPFKWRSGREGQLIDRLSRFEFEGQEFEIKLDGFDGFEPRVIFVDVVESEPLRALYTTLSKYIRRELKVLNSDYKSRGFHPHMTIGFRDLKKAAFYEAMSYFKNQSYSAFFNVKGFWLLKHDGVQWHPLNFFSFDRKAIAH